jgi:hypothetical protein
MINPLYNPSDNEEYWIHSQIFNDN